MRVTVESLVCRRSGRLVFAGLSFALEAGEAVAVTGRNGAGKSSLLAILSGRLRADGGTVRVEGAGDRTLPETLHLVGHRDALKSSLTAEENLRFAQDLLGQARLSPREALARVGLEHAAALPVAYLSAGQRRRVALARLLVAHRPLWLLDEPLSALDAASQEMLRGLMREHLAGGGLIIAATHQPLEVGEREVGIARQETPPAPPLPLAGRAGVGVGTVENAVEGQATSLPSGEGLGWGMPRSGMLNGLGGLHRPHGRYPTLHPSPEGREAPGSESLSFTPTTPAPHPSPQGGGGSPLRALFLRDLRLAARVGGSGALGLVFFLMLVTLVPFALGPDLNLLARIGPAILWLAAVLATLITLDRLVQADDEDGSLDLLRSAPAPLELLVLVKALAHWTATGLPLALAAPVFGLLVALDLDAMGATLLTLLVGTPALAFVGAAGAALTASVRRGGLLLSILVLPLMVPTLIFGVSAANAALGGTVPFGAPLLILLAITLAAAVAGTAAAAAALRYGE